MNTFLTVTNSLPSSTESKCHKLTRRVSQNITAINYIVAEISQPLQVSLQKIMRLPTYSYVSLKTFFLEYDITTYHCKRIPFFFNCAKKKNVFWV